jgi:hypothetical protein
LQNEELYLRLVEHFEGNVTLSNVFERLSVRDKFCGSVSFSFPEIEFLASHFHELGDSLLNSLSLDHIHSILSKDCLRIKSEDDLYGFIMSRLSEQVGFSSLLSFVRFEFLSVTSIQDFISSDFDSFTLLSRSVWTQICRRLILSVSPLSRNDRLISSVIRSIVLSTGSPLEGIISRLTSEHGGNVHDRGIVRISAVDPDDSRTSHHPKNVADLTATNTYFLSRNAPNQQLIYDFQTLRVTVRHYSIRSCHVAQHHHPRSWVIEVSSDGSKWFEIDCRENNTDLNGSSLIGTFSVSTSKECRQIRLRQIGLNHYGGNCLLLSAFEVFGHFHES